MVEASFYSDVVECLPVDPATWVRFRAWTGKNITLYDNGAHRKYPTLDPSSNSQSLIRNDSLWPGNSGIRSNLVGESGAGLGIYNTSTALR